MEFLGKGGREIFEWILNDQVAQNKDFEEPLEFLHLTFRVPKVVGFVI